MNNSMVTRERQRLQLLPTPPIPNRIRSHSLKPRHSRQDYARRKSAADASSETMTHLELSTDNNEFEQANTPPPRRPSAVLSQRRYTVVSFEQQQSRSNQQRRMTTGRFSIFDYKSNSNILRQKRPSIISQVVEVVHLFI